MPLIFYKYPVEQEKHLSRRPQQVALYLRFYTEGGALKFIKIKQDGELHCDRSIRDGSEHKV